MRSYTGVCAVGTHTQWRSVVIADRLADSDRVRSLSTPIAGRREAHPRDQALV